MTDATILIPTHDHAALLPFAVRSALAQEGVSIELVVVGDGVGDDTREALEPFRADGRIRFHDRPKGARHGERLRHDALQEATGRIVCYLSDDDLLLPDHAATMAGLLTDADFAHSAPAYVEEDRSLAFLPMDIARNDFRALLLSADVSFSLSGAAHTLDAYRRLPHGWRPAPPGIWTDLYMWQQFLSLDGLRGVTSRRLTHLHFPSPVRVDWTVSERVAELAEWEQSLGKPRFAGELASRLEKAVFVAGENYRAAAIAHERAFAHAESERARLTVELDALRATRTLRLREHLIRSRLLRALLARSPEAR
jgi:hypothetical protein